jgi:hypothetical protein
LVPVAQNKLGCFFSVGHCVPFSLVRSSQDSLEL